MDYFARGRIENEEDRPIGEAPHQPIGPEAEVRVVLHPQQRRVPLDSPSRLVEHVKFRLLRLALAAGAGARRGSTQELSTRQRHEARRRLLGNDLLVRQQHLLAARAIPEQEPAPRHPIGRRAAHDDRPAVGVCQEFGRTNDGRRTLREHAQMQFFRPSTVSTHGAAGSHWSRWPPGYAPTKNWSPWRPIVFHWLKAACRTHASRRGS